VALGGRLATHQTPGIQVDGLRVLLGPEKIVAFLSDVRRQSGTIVLHFNVQRPSQHFVFYEQRAREQKSAFGSLQR